MCAIVTRYPAQNMGSEVKVSRVHTTEKIMCRYYWIIRNSQKIVEAPTVKISYYDRLFNGLVWNPKVPFFTCRQYI